MRVALVSPMPPSPSGIADYSAALAGPLAQLVDLECFGDDGGDDGRAFDPARFDALLYHVGNNPHHVFVYRAALRHPGVVVLHEANLHHLVAAATIRRGDWDAYLRECEYDGGAEALAFAGRVRALEIGPDYDGVCMTRRLLENARAVIVHSRYMFDTVRARGFTGPLARIPHGAWIPCVDRRLWRARLGLDECTPLVGVFGHLKPYKRIIESLRAFRRLVRLAPQARMILVGEPHPDCPVRETIHALGLPAQVRVIGFAPIEEFTGYMAACDIVLNLRFPTVGETSGSLLRAMGLGKAVLVSEVGAFGEYPGDVCLKVPVGPGEEDLIFEYLNLLVSRPDVAATLGGRARAYVERECRWERVAASYAEFLAAVAEDRPYGEGPSLPGVPAVPEAPAPAVPPAIPKVEQEYIEGWAADDDARAYIATHITRLAKTLEITPAGGPDDRILEMGAYLQITPALRTKLGYGEVRGCYYGPAGRVDHRVAVSAAGERFACDIDHFDAEKDCFPYPDEHFSTVLCCELIEHLFGDPMHMMGEINRILKPGGHLVLTTPNIAALRGIAAILQGYHPGFFHAYIRPRDGETDPRHNREYTPDEVRQLLENSGFEVTLLETGEFRDESHPEQAWVRRLLEIHGLSTELRGEGIYAVGQKCGPVRERYPGWLYT